MPKRNSNDILALFIVVFDQKIGYSIAWQRKRTNINLEGVEFKSMPSGLHGQHEDIVYFLHEGHAGLSAFVQAASDEEHRNAQFAAVGVIVKDDVQVWTYKESLRRLAQVVVEDLERHHILEMEEFWHGTFVAEQDKQSADPTTALPDLLDSFGPLLFPLYRQALLQKRILLVGQPPVQGNCNIVHNLASISKLPTASLTQLYNVGISDITVLSKQTSWLACTTDAILKDKSTLYDIIIDTTSGSWPRIHDSQGNELKASQRDVDHLNALHRHLHQIGSTDEQALLSPDKDYSKPEIPWDIIESYSWSSVAQRSITWWNSDASEQPESEEFDCELLTVSTEPADVISEYFQGLTRCMIDKLPNHGPADVNEVLPTILGHAGLDPWSYNDRRFFEELGKHLDKHVVVADVPVTLCGVRVC